MNKETSSHDNDKTPPEPKFTAATNNYVEQINRLHLQEGQLWIEQGRLVHEFVLLAKKKAPNSNAYRLLADHPDSILEASMLRNYEQSFILWTELGGDRRAPKLPVSFYIQVLGSNLDSWNKEKLLRQAIKEHLSTRHLQQRIRQVHGQGKPELPPKGWEKTVLQLVAATKRTYELASWLVNIQGEQSITDEIRENLKTLVHYLIFHDLIRREELTEMLLEVADGQSKEEER